MSDYLDRLQLRMLSVLEDSMDETFLGMEDSEAKKLIVDDRINKVETSMEIMRSQFVEIWANNFVQFSIDNNIDLNILIEDNLEDLKKAGVIDYFKKLKNG